jgi:hypothetical protein
VVKIVDRYTTRIKRSGPSIVIPLWSEMIRDSNFPFKDHVPREDRTQHKQIFVQIKADKIVISKAPEENQEEETKNESSIEQV